ncbi:hypothetical protein [Mangrovibacillus cuniculi]|uniref:SbsA Ig-like domain-containing protein n=1 Tax=Mangrovibacillus cuniculi TaxID=2593652 RepID=A0A7S8CD20_9BACI|nr:hypothetical protein [Mangrovibacillus cuniculi]QPC47548.1 hypothetical protein G8O30_11600 [Mangrovibacillus cuniculi]
MDGSSTAVTVDTTLTGGVSAGEVGYVVSDDKKSVTLVFGTTLSQGTDIAVKAEKLKSVNGVEFSGTKYATANDVTFPEVLEARSINAKTIEVKFSEPVQFSAISKVFSEFLIDGNKVAGTTSLNTKGDVVTLVLNTKLNPGAYGFSVEPVSDFANLKTTKKEFTISAVEDTTAPEVVSVEAGRTQVEVTFNENVDANAGSITIDGTVYNLSAGTVSVSGNKVTVDISGDPLTAAAAFLQQTLTYKGIKDVLGNEVNTTDGKTFNYYAKNDNVKPTASVKVNSDNTITVEFSETVQGFTSSNIELTDSNDAVVALAATPVSTVTAGKKYTINLATANVDAQAYKLVIKDVKDDSVVENTMDKFTTTVSLNDKKAPLVTGNITMVGTNKARITFDEAMSATTLLDKSNYLYDADATGTFESLSNVADVVIAVAGDNKSVDITIPGLEAADVFKLLNLKDASSTRLDSTKFNTNLIVSAQGQFTHANIASVVAKTRNTVEITAASRFNFASVDPNKFVLVDAASPSTTMYVTSATISSDQTKVTLTLNSNLTYNALSGSTALKLHTVSGQTAIKDTMNRALDITSVNAITVADGIKPVVSSIAGTTSGSDADEFAITFSEAIDADITMASILNDIIVKDKNGNTVSVTTSDLAFNVARTVLTVTLQDGTPSNDEFAGTYTVQVLDRSIKDEDGVATTGFGLNVVEAKTVTGVVVK